jgi:dolichol-phosphate mannosyltransferase
MQHLIRKPLISLVFSFRNEAENLDALIARCRATMNSIAVEHEMIFVNDDSNDRSIEILRRYAAQDRRIKVMTMSRRFGPSPCALAGMARACGDAVVYMDSDLQDPPELVAQLVEEWRHGADVVNTTRTKRHGESALKLLATRVAYRIINSLSDTDIPMNTGDFKLMSRRVVNQLIRLKEYDPFLRGLVRWVGFKQVQVFYERDARFAGETHFPLFGSRGPARAFVSGIASFSAAPLYFGVLVGGVVSLLSFLYLAFILATTLVFHMNLPGWPAQMVTMLFLGGITLFTIGMQGVYVGRMYQDLKGRPSYIVADEMNFEDGVDEVDTVSRVEKTRSLAR